MLRLVITFFLTAFLYTGASAQVLLSERSGDAKAADRDWVPTGVWPFLNRRFLPAEVVTGFVTKKKTVVPCNIHVGKQTLWYAQNDTLMEANAGSISRVSFVNGDVYVPLSDNAFGKVIHEDSVGKVIRLRLVDKKKFDDSANDASRMGSFSLGGDFGSLNLDLISSYVANPEEDPLPILDTFYFIYKYEIFEMTDKNILSHINPQRRKEYKAFTRSAEILSHSEASAMKIWNEFFVKW